MVLCVARRSAFLHCVPPLRWASSSPFWLARLPGLELVDREDMADCRRYSVCWVCCCMLLRFWKRYGLGFIYIGLYVATRS